MTSTTVRCLTTVQIFVTLVNTLIMADVGATITSAITAWRARNSEQHYGYRQAKVGMSFSHRWTESMHQRMQIPNSFKDAT